MYASIDAHADSPALKVTIVEDQNTPRLRIQHGPLYLSLTMTECVDLLDGLTGALAEIDRQATVARLARDESAIRAEATLREDM